MYSILSWESYGKTSDVFYNLTENSIVTILCNVCRWVVRELCWCKFIRWRFCVSSFSLRAISALPQAFLRSIMFLVYCPNGKWGQRSLVSHCWVLGGLGLYCDSLRATASVIVGEMHRQRALNLKCALRQWGSIAPVSITFCKASMTHYICCSRRAASSTGTSLPTHSSQIHRSVFSWLFFFFAADLKD